MTTTLSLSHSQVDQFTQCPRRWKLTKLDRVPQAPSEALILGSAVHAAIEATGQAWKARGEHLTAEDLHAAAGRAFEEQLAQQDPHGLLADALDGMHARASHMLDLFAHHVLYDDDGQVRYKPTAVEEPFSLSVPDANGLVFTGRIDAMQDGPHGPIVIDHKTAGKPWPVGAEHEKDQASAYLLATAPVHATRVTFVVLSPQGVSIRPTVRTERQLDAYVAKVRATATAIETAKASGEFDARTGPLCGWCSVIHACAEGRKWLVDHGRTPAVPVLETEVAS